jgi:hypothetical protein
MRKLFAAAAAAALSLAASAAQAESFVLGLLVCQNDEKNPGATYVVFSQRPVTCTYNGAGGSHAYQGTAGMIGVDLEFQVHDVMAYLVVGGAATPGSVEGGYIGAKASFKVGAGLSAQAGLAGAGNGFALVPAGIGGGIGIGAAAGIAYLNLSKAK